MEIKYLILENFRQFKGIQRIDFSTDKDKNVTIVMADNTLGKTTIQESFRWAFYGESKFSNKEVFNIDLKRQLNFNHLVTSVEVGVLHLGTEYKIKRSQELKHNGGANYASDVQKVSVEYITSEGRSELEVNQIAQNTINEIMPEDLFDYFFFNGERIEGIGKQISRGKSAEFSKAVEAMLGFTALKNSLNHLKAASSEYRNEIKKIDADSEYSQLIGEIEGLNQTIDELNKEIEENNNNILYYDDLIKDLSREIEKNSVLENKQKKVNDLQRRIESNKVKLAEYEKRLFRNFSSNSYNYAAQNLIKRAESIIQDSDLIDTGIPGMNTQTIDYLIKRQKCICGCDLLEGTKPLKKIIEAKEYLPPNNISSESKMMYNNNEKMKEKAREFYDSISEQKRDINEMRKMIANDEREVESLNKSIMGNKDVGEMKVQEIEARKQRDRLKERSGALKLDLLKHKNKLELLERNKDNIKPKQERQQQLSLYEEYTEAVYSYIKSYYEKKENEQRERLQNEINEIFSIIFDDNNKIFISDDYNIDVINAELGYSVEKSSAQNVSITLAFIAGIIKMAREKIINEPETDNKILEDELMTEPYPLVMDAPLSSFDMTRIKNVCDVLPSISEQVIIFIKDTDGTIAKEHMIHYIGEEYHLEQVDDLHTKIRKGPQDVR